MHNLVGYYADAAREVARHVREVREGEHTVGEFAASYGLVESVPAPEDRP